MLSTSHDYGKLARPAGSAHRICEVVDRALADKSSTLTDRPENDLLSELGLALDDPAGKAMREESGSIELPTGYTPIVKF